MRIVVFFEQRYKGKNWSAGVPGAQIFWECGRLVRTWVCGRLVRLEWVGGDWRAGRPRSNEIIATKRTQLTKKRGKIPWFYLLLTSSCQFVCDKKPIPANPPKKMTQNLRIRFFGNEEMAARMLSHNFFGTWLTPDLLMGVVGAIPCSEIFVGNLQNRFYVEHYEADQLGLTGSCRISRNRQGELILFQELSIHRADKRNRGMGTQIFDRQVESCKQLGIRRILMFGRKNRLEWGYYVLPRFGFDGPLPKNIQLRLPKHFQHPATLGKLFETSEGRSWWKQNGIALSYPLSYRIAGED